MALSNASGYSFSNQQFRALAKLVHRTTGIVLGDSKKDLAYARFAKRIRQLKMNGFDEYIARLDAGDTVELDRLTSLISTNVTSFYRESHHFEFLHSQFGELVARRGTRLRFWSAGCSTGQEPYSVGATLLPEVIRRPELDLKILATDVDADALRVASTGIYPRAALGKVPRQLVSEAFDRHDADQVIVTQTLSKLCHFKRLNLLDSWPMRGPFDVIFCRNVVIYFDEPTKKQLYAKMAALQRPGDYLIVGHSESLLGLSEKYECLGNTVYVRT